MARRIQCLFGSGKYVSLSVGWKGDDLIFFEGRITYANPHFVPVPNPIA